MVVGFDSTVVVVTISGSAIFILDGLVVVIMGPDFSSKNTNAIPTIAQIGFDLARSSKLRLEQNFIRYFNVQLNRFR